MSYHVLKNTWVGVTSEPVQSKEDYFYCNNLVDTCESVSDLSNCHNYHKIEGEYIIPCKKKVIKNKPNKCKANTGSKIKMTKYDPLWTGTNICGTVANGQEIYICGEPCNPISDFNKTDTCSELSGFIEGNNINNCIGSYKTENATSPAPSYNVYCKAKIKNTAEVAQAGEFECKPDDENIVKP